MHKSRLNGNSDPEVSESYFEVLSAGEDASERAVGASAVNIRFSSQMKLMEELLARDHDRSLGRLTRIIV